MLIAETY